MSKLLIKREIKIPQNLGYISTLSKDKKRIYTFLSSKMQKIWLHHLMGANAIIILYEGEDIEKGNNELLTLLSNKYLINIPILIIFDKNKNDNKKYFLNENIREKLTVLKIKVNTLYVDFSVNIKNNEFNFGVDWIEKEINNNK